MSNPKLVRRRRTVIHWIHQASNGSESPSKQSLRKMNINRGGGKQGEEEEGGEKEEEEEGKRTGW